MFARGPLGDNTTWKGEADYSGLGALSEQYLLGLTRYSLLCRPFTCSHIHEKQHKGQALLQKHRRGMFPMYRISDSTGCAREMQFISGHRRRAGNCTSESPQDATRLNINGTLKIKLQYPLLCQPFTRRSGGEAMR